jgi:hypothetical protein
VFITADELKAYTGVIKNADASLQETYVGAAEDIVCNYLGYTPIKAARRDILDGSGGHGLYVRAKPVAVISGIYDIGTGAPIEGTPEGIVAREEFIYSPAAVFPEGKKNILVEYEAGYEMDALPAVIKLTALRIAALLQTEADNNIGVNSKSFAESGTRVFTNFQNFDKYLAPISRYKLLGV